MRRKAFISFVVCILLTSWSNVCRAQFDIPIVHDKINQTVDKAGWANRFLEATTNLLQEKFSLEELEKARDAAKKVYEAANKFAIYSSEFREFYDMAASVYNIFQDDVEYVKSALDRGEISPYEADRLLNQIMSTAEVCTREIEYIMSIVMKENNQTAGEQLEDIKEANGKIRGQVAYLEDEIEEAKYRAELGEKIMSINETLDDCYYGECSESDKAEIKRTVEEMLIPKQQEPVQLDSNAKKSFNRIAYLLIGLILLAYIPYNLYKLTKGEQQAHDALLKVVVAGLMGGFLLFLFNVIFL